MLKRITSYFVNWVDGMRITKDDFIAQDHAVRDHLRDVTALTLSDAHYGLLEPAQMEVEGNTVRLVTCRAVCRDGSRIELLASQEQQVSCDLHTWLQGPYEGKSFYLVAMVQPQQPVGHGPWEGEPPRQLRIAPRVSLEVVPTEKFNQSALMSAMLPIDKFVTAQGRAERSKEYVPPALFIAPFPGLEALRRDLSSTLELIGQGSTRVLDKLYGRHRELQYMFPNHCYIHWGQHSLLACTRIRAQLAIGMDRPMDLVRATIELALGIESVLGTVRDRRDLMKHVEGIGNWASLIRAMEQAGKELAQMDHVHWDMAGSLAAASRFLAYARDVYGQLGELERFEVVQREVAPNVESAPLIPAPKPPKPPIPPPVWER